jgi:hypothetical protein
MRLLQISSRLPVVAPPAAMMLARRIRCGAWAFTAAASPPIMKVDECRFWRRLSHLKTNL